MPNKIFTSNPKGKDNSPKTKYEIININKKPKILLFFNF